MSSHHHHHRWIVLALGLAACDQPQDPVHERDADAPECGKDCDMEVPAAASDERRLVGVDGHPSRGPSDALVTVVAFSDFECPFCSKAAREIENVLAKHEGRVRLVFRNMPLPMHDRADEAALAGLAAHRQGKFWAMHDALFAAGGNLSADDLETYAEDIGLDVAQFRRDLADPTLLAALKRDTDEAAKLGVKGTPSFFVNGRMIVGARPAAELDELVRTEIAAAESFVAKNGGRENPYGAMQARL